MTHTDIRASAIVAVLEAAWNAIRANAPEVPAAVVILASGTLGRKSGVSLGHHAPMRWVPAGGGAALSEVMVAGESLALGAEEVLNTLLHEAAHALAFSRKIQDTSRGGRVHNKRFRALAIELGLTPPPEWCPKLGWSGMLTPEATLRRYSRQLAAIRKAATVTRRAEAQAASVAPGGPQGTPEPGGHVGEPPRAGNGNGVVLVCAGCGRKLRQRGKAERLTICALPDATVCGIMTPEERGAQ